MIYQYPPFLLVSITHIHITHQQTKKQIHINIQEPESEL